MSREGWYPGKILKGGLGGRTPMLYQASTPVDKNTVRVVLDSLFWDEDKLATDYMKLSSDLAALGYIDYSTMVANMVLDESRHRSMIKQINEGIGSK